jgi:isoleucyl-tRNA synthetase
VADGKDYKDTLRLPRTAFPMKANLREREPIVLDFWRDEKVYEGMIAAATTGGGVPFVFHDGPPYANGHIHPGTILNKVLKDIVLKSRNMTGRPCEYRPGWDCHGLPIEHAVEKEIGREAARADPSNLRRKCREFALRWVDIQREEFKRLGVLGTWDDPYLTMTHDYEALTLREFGRFVGNGSVYQGRKPVLWCPVCETALADAEVEYKDAPSPSIYVRFPFTSSVGQKVPELAGREGAVVIWTTTPWTLPANLAIAFDPEAFYVAEQIDGQILVFAEDLRDSFLAAIGKEPGTVVARFPGKSLEGAACRHPFIDRESLLLVGEHVTLDTGTGCVHTAPGFGEDDFVVGARYGLPVYAPVNGQGRFTEEVPEYAGRFVFECDSDIIERMRNDGTLLAASRFTHSYPHCWRSKNPIVFRATPQWFIAVDKEMDPDCVCGGKVDPDCACGQERVPDRTLRGRAMASLGDVKFIPAWGRDRISGMLKSRPDWCISRQRHWGVPIVAVSCRSCGNVQTSRDLVEHVAALFEKEGADAWFDRDLPELIPTGTACNQCGGTDLEKVRDILDVWFDSGTSYAAVMEARYGTGPRTDLYLEGSDQHRGWFQSSLLASVGTRGQAPYRAVLTHGFVVDGNGRKMSKSEGNFVDPKKIIDQNGADLLRLWTAAEDYRDDIRLSNEILSRLVEAYRKIRNTVRFMLGVVDDFDPELDMVADDRLLEVDRWALLRFSEVVDRVRTAYEGYEFHVAVRTILDFIITDLSAFYLDITKDRLYCGAPNSMERRSAQTTVWRLLEGLLRMMAPILSFTIEEAWSYLAKTPGMPRSVLLARLPEASDYPKDEALLADMKALLEVRGVVLKRLEEARASKVIGHPLEANVVLRVRAGGQWNQAVTRFEAVLPELFVVSGVSVERPEALPGVDGPAEVVVDRSGASRCARCWGYYESVGTDQARPDLCARCSNVMEGLAQ